MGTKLDELFDWMKDRDRLAVAFSGGVDSSLVLAASVRILGRENILAMTGVSPTLPAAELRLARELSNELGVEHRLIATSELENSDFSSNPPDRCYHCKQEFWSRAGTIAADEGFRQLADGANADDILGHRPGLLACEAAGVRHPLVDIGASKEDVRAMAKGLGLSSWDKPAQACLSSRFPYGNSITEEGLLRVEAAEACLMQQGFRHVRVRDHDGIARIEVGVEELERLAANSVREAIAARFKQLGYDYVTMDLEGFRSGSMNEVISDGRADGEALFDK